MLLIYLSHKNQHAQVEDGTGELECTKVTWADGVVAEARRALVHAVNGAHTWVHQSVGLWNSIFNCLTGRHLNRERERKKEKEEGKIVFSQAHCCVVVSTYLTNGHLTNLLQKTTTKNVSLFVLVSVLCTSGDKIPNCT